MKKIELPVSVLLILLLLSSCLPSAAPLPANPTATAPVVVIIPATQTSQPAASTPTPTPIITATARAATPTLAPTQTQAATEMQPAQTVTLPASAPGCNKAGFVSDVTVPSGTVVAATEVFVKTWRLVNLGTCTWTADYQVVPMQGDQVSGYGSFNLGASVAPGHTVDISITVTAPVGAANIGGSYRLQSPDGEVFGVEADGNSSFGYLVYVREIDLPAPFQVTSVSMSSNASSVAVSCPPGKKFVFTAKISVNAAGTVTYHWVTSDGGTSNDETLVFNEAGSQSVSTSWALGTKKSVSPNPFSGWVQIYINNPNHQSFGRINFKITCS
jgi:hypothetical protein